METSVTFDEPNSALRNVTAFFTTRLPDGVRWTIEIGDAVVPGTTIGYWHWDDDPETEIVAPDDCRGILDSINDRLSLQLLDRDSQVLIQLVQRPAATASRH